MSSKTNCQLCGSSQILKSSLTIVAAIDAFLKHTKVLKVKSSEAIVCFTCFQSITRFNTFIEKIIEHRDGKSKNFLGKVPVGITIKKVKSTKKNPVPVINENPEPSATKSSTPNIDEVSLPVSQDISLDPLNVESVFVKAEPNETFAVKCEPAETSAIINEPMETDEPSDHEEDDFFAEEYSFLEEVEKPTKSRKTRVSELNFTCANCKNSYNDFDTLTKHITSRICNSTFKCGFCSRFFDDKRKFQIHKKSHYSRQNEASTHIMTCAHCPKTFTKEPEFQLHMETHVRVVKTGFTFRCIQCRATFDSHLDLINHTNQEHPKLKKRKSAAKKPADSETVQ